MVLSVLRTAIPLMCAVAAVTPAAAVPIRHDLRPISSCNLGTPDGCDPLAVQSEVVEQLLGRTGIEVTHLFPVDPTSMFVPRVARAFVTDLVAKLQGMAQVDDFLAFIAADSIAPEDLFAAGLFGPAAGVAGLLGRTAPIGGFPGANPELFNAIGSGGQVTVSGPTFGRSTNPATYYSGFQSPVSVFAGASGSGGTGSSSGGTAPGSSNASSGGSDASGPTTLPSGAGTSPGTGGRSGGTGARGTGTTGSGGGSGGSGGLSGGGGGSGSGSGTGSAATIPPVPLPAPALLLLGALAALSAARLHRI